MTIPVHAVARMGGARGMLWRASERTCSRHAKLLLEDAVTKFHTALRRMVLALAALLCALVPGSCPHAQNSSGPTHLQVTGQVLLPSVTRLGINLGEQNFYDSGQMNRNLIFRNPGFEGLAYRTIFHCVQGGQRTCTDTRPGIQFPDKFWNGAYAEVIDGAQTGSHGVVSAAGAAAGGYSFSLTGSLQISSGDWISVYKGFYGEPTAGWWPKSGGNASFTAERSDLPPGSQGRQALHMTALERGSFAQITSYLDSFEGVTFLRLRGRYRLSFRAKSVRGGRMLHVHVGRVLPGFARYLNREIPLTTAWAAYREEFDVQEGQLPPAAIEVALAVSGGDVLLDDVALEKIDGDPANHTVFRDEVLETLRDLHPGVLRMMGSGEELGSTIDNLLAPVGARVRAGYFANYAPTEDISISIPEFLELCRAVDAEPWITLPAAISPAEARKLAEYLAGPADTTGGALRAQSGHREPWTASFRTLHIELGNETWNTVYQGETIDDPAAYGRRANLIFTAFRTAAGQSSSRFDLMVGTNFSDPYRNRALLSAAHEADTLAIAPYLMSEVSRWNTDQELFAPLLAQPEQMEREGFVKASRASAGSHQMAVYEVNLHSTRGTAPLVALDRLTPSAAAGIAVVSHMLRMMRDEGVRNQALFALPQYQFRRGDGTPVRLWGSVVEMGKDGRKRPQFLAASIANRALHGNLVRVAVSGADPTRDQPLSNDGVQLHNQHLIDAYGFRDGHQVALIVFNYDLQRSHAVILDRPFSAPSGARSVTKLNSSSPASNNEGVTQVMVQTSSSVENQLTLPPCSMTLLEWQE